MTGPEIQAQVAAGRILIDPWDKSRLNPNSYNLRLGSRLATYRLRQGYGTVYKSTFRQTGDDATFAPWILDMRKKPEVDEIEIPDDGYILTPGRLYLGTTIERTYSPDFVPVIEGRSSVARLGMFVHITAGFGDVGFDGHWTLEIVVVHPLRIYAGVAVCQVAFTRPEGEIRPYAGKYRGQVGPQPSKLWTELGRRDSDALAGVAAPPKDIR